MSLFSALMPFYCLCCILGLVGDILLNNSPLRDFTIYSLDMKTSFIDRFVYFNFQLVVLVNNQVHKKSFL